MIDQYWQFESVDIQLLQSGFNNRRWVPLALTIDEDIMPNYYNYMVVNSSKGIGITKSCEDVDGAMKVINDLLDPEILILRNWGEKNIDYMIDENGEFYRTDEQRENLSLIHI